MELGSVLWTVWMGAALSFAFSGSFSIMTRGRAMFVCLKPERLTFGGASGFERPISQTSGSKTNG